MTQYLLYKKRNSVTPFVIVNENTIDNTSTSVFLVGKRTENYGQSEEQSKLWLLENFASTTKPAASILGQEWFNTSDNKMYVCINETGQVYEKVGKPIVSASAPTTSITAGDLWYNTGDNKLYSYSGTSWGIVGPISTVPVTAQQVNFLTGVTTDGTPTEIFINGINGSRLTVAPNQSWTFKIELIGRVSDVSSEVISMAFRGAVDRPNVGSVNLPGGVSTDIFNITGSFLGSVTAQVSANVLNNALSITVVGQAGKIIQWNAICTAAIVTN